MIEFKEDITKTARQEESINKWRAAKGIGTLLLCPRFGKTLIGRNISLRTSESKPTSSILILTPSDYINKQWKSYFDSKSLENPYLHIYSINEFIEKCKKDNGIDSIYDLVIVDEVHKFISDVRYEVLKELKLKSKWWLNLLGIMPHEKKRDMILDLAPIVDEITTEEAILKNWVSPFIEYNIKLNLSDVDTIKYTRFTTHIKDTLEVFQGVDNKVKYNGVKLFENEFNLIYGCYTGKKLRHGFVEGKVFRELTASVMGWTKDLDLSTDYGQQRNKYWNPNAIYERCKNFANIVKVRNELLTDNLVKLEAINDLINKYPVPTIIFNESIDFVTKIADKLGKDAIAYHSKIESRPIWDEITNDWIRYGKTSKKAGEPKMFGKATIKDETIKGIISGKYKYLVTAKALDEGLDIPNLEQVIITSGSTNPIQQGQRVGRGCTFDNNNPTKQTKIFNLYFDDIILESGVILKSRDKTKLLERQTQNAIEICTLDEIS
jgi:superfamily II DNA or RNA helicase